MFSIFKGVSVYRLNRDIPLDAEKAIELFSHFAFTACSSNEMARSGFISPITGTTDGELAYCASGFLMALIKHEKKVLPTDVLKEALAAKVEQLEVKLGRQLKKTEKDTLKDEVLHTLLPRAFSRHSKTAVLFDIKGKRIFVNGSAKIAENAMALIRKTLGSLPVVPLTMENPIELTLTEWLKAGNLPAGFSIGERAQLKSVLEAGGVINCNKQDLMTDEISGHIEAGKVVTKLALDWQERIQFVLADDGVLSGIKFSDDLREQNDDIDRDDSAARTSADIILMASELVALVDDLTSALGGEAHH